MPDQWQVQIQAKVQDHAGVVMRSSYLAPEDLAPAHLEHTDDVAATVASAGRRRAAMRALRAAGGAADDPLRQT